VEVFDHASTREYSRDSLITSRHITSGQTPRKHRLFSYVYSFHGNVFASSNKEIVYQEFAFLATALSRRFVTTGKRLPSRYLAMDISSGSTISGFRRHVTICIQVFRRSVTGFKGKGSTSQHVSKSTWAVLHSTG
jgi:hypothetical protein